MLLYLIKHNAMSKHNLSDEVVVHCRYRWAFIPEASDDSGLEVRRQGTHQREFKPYVVRLVKLLRKRAKVQ